MSWLYSQALVAASSAASCSAGALSAPSSGESTPQAFCAPDKMKGFSRLSRFGMTFKHLTDGHGAALLTWYLAGFHARTSAWPARAQALPASDPACGATWRGSLARFDPASRSWKTAQRSLLGDSEPSSVTWPRSGMTAAGQCWELPTSAQTISATASGLLPTPLASNTKAHHMRSNGRPARSYWPTPTTQDNAQVRGEGAAGMWRTPGASVVEPKSTVVKLTGRKPSDPQVGLADQVGGSLNPTWVEWLMGWPLGWTDLKPSAMDKFPCAQPALGDC